MELSVVIPAYNEAKRIGPTLQSVCSWLASHRSTWEVIVVNNRSTDTTAEVVRQAKAHWHSIRLIDEPKPGKGHAVATGMRFAAGQVRLFMDADNSTTIDHLERAEPFLAGGYDVVIGSLTAKGSTIVRGGGEPWWRVLLGKLGNVWIRMWAVPGIHDTQRGFKIFTAKAAHAIFSRMTIFGWGFDVEVLAIARIHGFRIKEIPVRWNNDPDSKVNMWAYPMVLWETVKIGWHRLIGTYRT